MRKTLALPMVALGLAFTTTTAAMAQTQPPDTAAVGTSVTVVPGANGAPSAAFVQSYAYQPVCQVRREQFVDEYGWRVRNVLVCR